MTISNVLKLWSQSYRNILLMICYRILLAITLRLFAMKLLSDERFVSLLSE